MEFKLKLPSCKASEGAMGMHGPGIHSSMRREELVREGGRRRLNTRDQRTYQRSDDILVTGSGVERIKERLNCPVKEADEAGCAMKSTSVVVLLCGVEMPVRAASVTI